MTEVCHDVCVEPTLQPITGEVLSNATAISDDGARLDIAANGFWGGRSERAFFDVRVFNPHAPSNRQPLPTCYRKHENQKKRAYEQRVREVEHGSFTPLVMSLTGGLGNAALVCYKRLASLISAKRDVPYSSTMAWIRCSLSFSLLRSSIQCIRGARSAIGHAVNPSRRSFLRSKVLLWLTLNMSFLFVNSHYFIYFWNSVFIHCLLCFIYHCTTCLYDIIKK